MADAGHSKGLAEPQALRLRRNAYYIDFADCRVRALLGMDLGPVESQELAGFVDSQEETQGVEPVFGFSGFEVLECHGTLFRVVGEGCPVRSKPGLLILSGNEGAERDAVREAGVGQC